MKHMLLFCLLAGVSFGQEKPTAGTWNTFPVALTNTSLFVTQSACQSWSQLQIDFGFGPETVAKCEKGKWVRIAPAPEPEDVPAVKKIVKSDLAYTADCNSTSLVCFGDTPACSDHGHFKKGAEYVECEGGWEWSCADLDRSLQVSVNDKKAWCHRGPE